MRKEDLICAQGKKVLVIGCGGTGDDCAETALAQGAAEVMQIDIMPEPSGAGYSFPADQQASYRKRKWSKVIKRFIGKGGRLTGAELAEIEWNRSPDGTVSWIEKAGSDGILTCDLALIAVGFVSCGNEELIRRSGVSLSPGGFVAIDESTRTSRHAVFCAGDMTNGSTLVVQAAASGITAAQNVARFLE